MKYIYMKKDSLKLLTYMCPVIVKKTFMSTRILWSCMYSLWKWYGFEDFIQTADIAQVLQCDGYLTWSGRGWMVWRLLSATKWMPRIFLWFIGKDFVLDIKKSLCLQKYLSVLFFWFERCCYRLFFFFCTWLLMTVQKVFFFLAVVSEVWFQWEFNLFCMLLFHGLIFSPNLNHQTKKLTLWHGLWAHLYFCLLQNKNYAK